MGEYKVQFEVFEGPLDLLLYLVKKEEVDIYQVNLTTLATQFIAYVDLLRELDLDIAGEFLVMASTLMYIKSRELLPVDKQVATPNEEEEGEDPRWELIRKLVEYKKFKDAAAQLQALELQQEQTYPRQAPKPVLERLPAPARTEASLFDLVSAVTIILKRFQERAGQGRDIFEDRWTVSEKIESIRQWLSEKPAFRFSELFGLATSRSEVVVTFLALLELVRLRQLVAFQTEEFGEIEIQRAAPPTAPASEPPPTLEVTAPTGSEPSPQSGSEGSAAGPGAGMASGATGMTGADAEAAAPGIAAEPDGQKGA